MNHSAGQNITAKVFKRSGLLSLARLLQVAVTFIIFWIFSLCLSKENYGIYQKAFVLISFFSGLCCLGLPVLIASLPAVALGAYIMTVIKRSAWVYLAAIIATSLFITFFTDFISCRTAFAAILLILFNAIYLVMEAYLVKLHHDRYVLLNNIVYAVLYFSIHLVIVKQAYFSVGQLVVWLCGLSFMRISLLLYSNRIMIASDITAPTDPTAGSHFFTQWKFLSLNEALDIFSRQVDKLFLLWLLTAAAFAIYFNGSYEIPLIGILISTTGTFITMQTVQQQHQQQVMQLLQQSSLVLACILFPLFFFLFFNATLLFHIFFRGNYNASIPVFLISSCIIPLRILNYTAILQGYHKGKEIVTGSIVGLIVKIVLSIVLYILWDVKGVALAFILGTLTQIIYYLNRTASVLSTAFSQLLPYGKILALFLITGALSFVVSLLLKDAGEPVVLIVQGILSILLIMVGLLFLRGKSNIL